jgi:Na+/H+-dicarboxylate symporter
MVSTWFEIALWKRIFAALILGAIVGMIWGPGSDSIAWVGTLFVRLIRMIVVPSCGNLAARCWCGFFCDCS